VLAASGNVRRKIGIGMANPRQIKFNNTANKDLLPAAYNPS